MLRGLTPEQNEGLMGMAAQMLQASGPSRMPVGFGQVLGAGLQGFSQSKGEAERRKIEQQQAEQMAAMRSLQMQGMQSDLSAQEAAQRQAAALAQFNQQYHARGQGAGASLPLQPESLPQLGAQPQMSVPGQQPAQESAPQGGLGGIFTERMQYAQAARAAGYEGAAKAAMEEALKFMPEVKEYKNVYGPDGKVYSKPYFKDGSSGAPIPAEVAEKLTEVNEGGKVTLRNSFTGVPMQTITKTAEPNAILQAQTAMRGQNMSAATAAKRLALDEKEFGLRATVGKAPTEFQGKSAAFGARAGEADKILAGLEKQGVRDTGIIRSVLTGAVETLPLVGDKLGNAVSSGMNTLPGVLGGPSGAQQQVEQARRDFVNAVLRQESGAAIGQTEFENATRQYFPQPGDTDAVVAQKARNRAIAIRGLNNNAGRAAFTPAAAPAGGDGNVVDFGSLK